MTTSEHDEVFAEQEQQSDDSEPPRHVDCNADSLAPIRGSSLLQHTGPADGERDYIPIVEKETAQLQELQDSEPGDSSPARQDGGIPPRPSSPRCTSLGHA